MICLDALIKASTKLHLCNIIELGLLRFVKEVVWVCMIDWFYTRYTQKEIS